MCVVTILRRYRDDGLELLAVLGIIYSHTIVGAYPQRRVASGQVNSIMMSSITDEILEI